MLAIFDDLRYGLRSLMKRRTFTLVTVCSLALGIGANTTVFTLVNAMLLRPLPVADPSSLAAVHTVDSRNPGLLLNSYPNYKSYREQNRVFSSLALYSTETINLTGHGEPRLVMGQLVSANYFSMLGVNPVIGRGFLPEEDAAAGASPVVVLSHAFWSGQFGADPRVTSQTISLNGRAYNIVGVAPKGFRGLNQLYAADLWAPVSMASQLSGNAAVVDRRRALLFSVVGRLQPGAAMAQAEAGMQAVSAELERQYPEDNRGRRARLTSITEAALAARTRSTVTNASTLLLLISTLVLLIACGNVANLLLAHAARRGKEIAIRLALGASRWRLIRQLLTESILLGLLGGAAGLALAKWSLTALWSLRPPLFNRAAFELSLDSRVLAYTLATSLLTGILFGLIPALRATRSDLATDLKQRTGRAASGRFRLGSVLVAAQVAFSAIALVEAALFVQSMLNATSMDPGFDAERLGMIAFNVADQGYNEARGREYAHQAREIAAVTPGVVATALAKDAPLRVGGARTALVDGQDNAGSGQGRLTPTLVVSPDYFRTMGIPLLRGRDFNHSDSQFAPRAAIVNEVAAAYFWPGEDALGRRLRFAGDPTPVLVIGVAHNANYQSIGEPPQAMIYLSIIQYYFPAAVLYIRTNGNPETVSGEVRKQMQRLDRNLPLQSESLGRTIRESLWPQRLSAGLLAVFGGIALLLSTLGIYGVIAYSVNQRLQEFGVRMALGATATQVYRMVISEGMSMAAAGVVLGCLIALGLTRAVRSMLFVVSPYDAATFLFVPLLLMAVALAACWAPATRAMRTDPARALRDE